MIKLKDIIYITIICLIIINLIGFAICGIDKKRAVKRQWRIPEKTFFIVSALFGAVGVYSGMFYFRHKTKHWYFVVGVPAIFIGEIILIFVIKSLL